MCDKIQDFCTGADLPNLSTLPVTQIRVKMRLWKLANEDPEQMAYVDGSEDLCTIGVYFGFTPNLKVGRHTFTDF